MGFYCLRERLNPNTAHLNQQTCLSSDLQGGWHRCEALIWLINISVYNLSLLTGSLKGKDRTSKAGCHVHHPSFPLLNQIKYSLFVMTCNLNRICRYQEKKKNEGNLLKVSDQVRGYQTQCDAVWCFTWSSSDLFVLAQGTQGNADDPCQQMTDGEHTENLKIPSSHV